MDELEKDLEEIVVKVKEKKLFFDSLLEVYKKNGPQLIPAIKIAIEEHEEKIKNAQDSAYSEVDTFFSTSELDFKLKESLISSIQTSIQLGSFKLYASQIDELFNSKKNHPFLDYRDELLSSVNYYLTIQKKHSEIRNQLKSFILNRSLNAFSKNDKSMKLGNDYKKSSTPGPTSKFQFMYDWLLTEYNLNDEVIINSIKEHGSAHGAGCHYLNALKKQFPNHIVPDIKSLKEKMGFIKTSGRKLIYPTN